MTTSKKAKGRTIATDKMFKTNDYGRFILHPKNRPEGNTNALRKSMQEFGFLQACAIHVRTATGGKLMIIRGHHRYLTAKELGVPLWYIIDETDIEPLKLETIGNNESWKTLDFVKGRYLGGDPQYRELIKFAETHGYGVSSAARLLGGRHKGGSTSLRNGTFVITQRKLAEKVVFITDACVKCGVSFANTSAFVYAITLVSKLPEFTPTKFLSNVEQIATRIRKCSSHQDYLQEIEMVYNYRSREQIPLRFNALKFAASRKKTKK